MKKRECGHEKFRDVRGRLEEAKQKFTRETMALLCFGDLMLSVIGNAGDAAGKWDDYTDEERGRMKRFEGFTPAQADEAEYCDENEWWAAFGAIAAARGMLEDADAPPEVLLYRNMRRLRGNWNGGRRSEYLLEIYRLLPICRERGNLAAGWLTAVERNADTFDGHMNDGRIFRDGQLYMPEDNPLGMPAGPASGNLAMMCGAKRVAGEYRGSYEELIEELLTPEARVEFLRPFTEVE